MITSVDALQVFFESFLNSPFQLVAVLREVKYIEISCSEDDSRQVPQSATAIYAENDTLRQFINSLELTAFWYNHVQKTVLHFEIALIEQPLKEIDETLLQATDDISWDNPGEKLHRGAVQNIYEHEVDISISFGSSEHKFDSNFCSCEILFLSQARGSTFRRSGIW